MYFKIVKHKTEERVFLEAHPLVRFINHPIDQIAITDGLHMRVQVVDTKQSKIDIVDRLKKDTKVYKRLFIIYPPNESDV